MDNKKMNNDNHGVVESMMNKRVRSPTDDGDRKSSSLDRDSVAKRHQTQDMYTGRTHQSSSSSSLYRDHPSNDHHPAYEHHRTTSSSSLLPAETTTTTTTMGTNNNTTTNTATPTNEELLAEYRLLLTRQETIQDQIRFVESRLAQRRWLEQTAMSIADLSSSLSSTRRGGGGDSGDNRFFPNDHALLLEQARSDLLLRRERQALLLEGATAAAAAARPYSVAEADTLRLLREREMLLARISPPAVGGGGHNASSNSSSLPDRLLSSDEYRRNAGLYPPSSSSLETLEELLAARARSNHHNNNSSDRFESALLLRGANQQTALSRSLIEESLGHGGGRGGDNNNNSSSRNSPPSSRQLQQRGLSDPSPRYHSSNNNNNSNESNLGGGFGPADQLQILQQIERQRRINESLMEQARMRDLVAASSSSAARSTTALLSSSAVVSSSSQPPPSSHLHQGGGGTTTSALRLRDMRGEPGANKDFKVGVLMSVDADHEKLSAFQALIRQSLEYFEATDDDVLTSVQGRRQKIRLGQIGVRCKYCSHLPIRSMARAKGAVYYPKTLISVYQAAQNIANSHFLVPCNFMPESVQKELALQRPKRDASLAGKPYWTRTCQELGIYEDDDALWHRESKTKNNSSRNHPQHYS